MSRRRKKDFLAPGEEAAPPGLCERHDAGSNRIAERCLHHAAAPSLHPVESMRLRARLPPRRPRTARARALRSAKVDAGAFNRQPSPASPAAACVQPRRAPGRASPPSRRSRCAALSAVWNPARIAFAENSDSVGARRTASRAAQRPRRRVGEEAHARSSLAPPCRTRHERRRPRLVGSPRRATVSWPSPCPRRARRRARPRDVSSRAPPPVFRRRHGEGRHLRRSPRGGAFELSAPPPAAMAGSAHG